MNGSHVGLANYPLDPNRSRDQENGAQRLTQQEGTNDQTVEEAGLSHVGLSQASIQQANAELISYMMVVLNEGRAQSRALYARLSWSYWLLVTMAVIVFGVGLALLSSPLWLPAVVPAGSRFDWFALVFPPTLGIANLLGLYLYNPIRRISLLMGTMTQLVVILNQYQIRIALCIVECDITDRPTVGAAAEEVRTIADYSLGAIKRYFDQAAKEQSVKGQTAKEQPGATAVNG